MSVPPLRMEPLRPAQRAAPPGSQAAAAAWRLYLGPTAALLLALPLWVYAFSSSLAPIQKPFPGFFVMPTRLVPSVSALDWPPERARLFHSQVVAINGSPVTTAAEIYEYATRVPAGTDVQYTLRKHGATFEVTQPTRLFRGSDYAQTHGVLLLFGLIGMGLGISVGFLKPGLRTARVYLVQAMVTGLYASTSVFLHRPGYAWLWALCPVLECFLGATWIHLSAVFPVERLRGTGRRWLALPYLVGVLNAAAMMRGFAADPPWLAPLYVSYAMNALGLICFVGAIITAYRQARDPLPRLRVKALVLGALVAAPLPAIAFIDNLRSGGTIPVQIGLVLAPFGYASIAYAIAKHDLFDIDRVIRRTFAYSVLSIVVVAAYAVALESITKLAPVLAPERALMSSLFVLVLALALEPLRQSVQRLVDRLFYRSRPDYQAMNRHLSAFLATSLDRRAIVDEVTRVVLDTLQLESVALGVTPEFRPAVLLRRSADQAVTVEDAKGIEALVSATTAAHRVLDISELAVQHPMLDSLKVKVIVPLIFRERGAGVLLLGGRRSGQPFDSEAIEALGTLADQVAIALQNAQAHQALEEVNRDLDAQVRQRTIELQSAYEDLKGAQAQLVQSEKMASLGQLVAGVAHELNNPASFVYAGFETIADFLKQLLAVIAAYERAPITDPAAARAIEEARSTAHLDFLKREAPLLLRISSEGIERIKSIIDDLTLFARADGGERAPVNIVSAIESCLRLLQPRLDAAGVRVETDFAATPEIDANAAQLNQVWMNLLTNAIDAVAGVASPTISITVSTESDPPRVRICIDDNGCGIPMEIRSRLFEPFFTTKPIGHGTGLGLSIAYGAVKAHGGTIEVQSELGLGTTVAVVLPALPLKESTGQQ